MSGTSELAAGAESGAAAGSRFRDYVALTKPRITVMVAVTAALGFAAGSAELAPGAGPAWTALWALLAGVSLACMGSAALNQAYEVAIDARMHRTKDRPVAAGRMSTGEGIFAGLALSLLGVFVIALGVGPAGGGLAAGLTALTVALYAFVYTPMKRMSPLALYVGAVPGAMPPLIGSAATGAGLTSAAWLLFGVMVVWQVPHFLAIAWLHRDDYGRAGLPMLAVTDRVGRAVTRRTLGGAALLVLTGPIGWLCGAMGVVSCVALAGLGVWFAWETWRMARRLDRASARRVFLTSLLYLPAALGVIVAGRVWEAS
ncbi:MAG: heme o synthase [Planctomycetota bacterium]